MLHIACSVLLAGCNEPMEEKEHTEHKEDTGQQVSASQKTGDETLGMTGSEPTVEQELPDYRYQQMPDVEVDYIQESSGGHCIWKW